ncbi:MAG: restriction endonuclease subunit S [Bacteroidota bacterium]|nr:restriction endonuclease subunit S [Bacteroidota bacterium]
METAKKGGYKMTEVGLIPSDWEVKEIGEVFNFFRTASFSREMLSIGQEFLYVHYGDIHTRFNHFLNIKNSDLPSINSKLAKNFTLIQNGDLIMADASEDYSGIGKSVEVEGITNQKVISGLHTMLMRANPDFLSNGFKAYLHSNILVKKQYDAKATGLKVYGVSKSNLKEIKIPLPPLPEQTAIATALKDTDDLINSVEKLIAKKKHIKQGAMQELLKPKEGWVKKKLGEVCWYQEGPGLRNWQFTKSGIKVINVTNLENGILNLERTDRHISLHEFHKMYEHFEIDENDIVVASSGNSYGKVAVVRKKDLPLVMNTSVIRFKPLENIDYNFLLIFLKSSDFKMQIDLLITGGAQPNFGPAHLNKISINLPKTKEDQNKISSILNDIEIEISNLETNKTKLQTIKQGMMQQLLTGKIRLI